MVSSGSNIQARWCTFAYQESLINLPLKSPRANKHSRRDKQVLDIFVSRALLFSTREMHFRHRNMVWFQRVADITGSSKATSSNGPMAWDSISVVSIGVDSK